MLGDQPKATGVSKKPKSNEAGDEFASIFRAISTPAQRRGIRLEAIYWHSLKVMAELQNISIGEVIERALGDADDGQNLTSVIRVTVARWLTKRMEDLERLTELSAVNPIVHASPVPTFMVTADKRIALYNRLFLELIHARFPSARADNLYRGLRLSIDTPVDQIVSRLKADRGAVFASGFALGIDGRRLRGSLNLVLAPIHDQDMLLAYLTTSSTGQ